ncbi:MAG TPA: ribbon-helix-helix domain-containing protein [Egibacteraceae bacterium]|nr:ribbon-helix-helix domain-containing protein [Egibacteraceae bacterium]
MVRTQISLTQEQKRLLDAEAARSGRSLAALIRAAVDAMYGPGGDLGHDLAAIRAAAGAWQDHTEDGAAYVERLRSGTRLPRR